MRSTHNSSGAKYAQDALRSTHIVGHHFGMRELVGKNIRALRKAKGWTVEQFAGMVDSDVGNISRLERGKQGFSDVILSKIAEKLGVDPVALFDSGAATQINPARTVTQLRSSVDPSALIARGGEETAIILLCRELPRADVALIKGYAEGKFKERYPGGQFPKAADLHAKNKDGGVVRNKSRSKT